MSAYNLQLKQFVEQFHREGPFALQTADPQAIRQAYALITQQQVGSSLCGWGWACHTAHIATPDERVAGPMDRASSLPPHEPTFHYALRILPSSSVPFHCAGSSSSPPPLRSHLLASQRYVCLSPHHTHCPSLQEDLCKMEDRARAISELEELFELAPSKFAALKVGPPLCAG